jgi:hypothetical protein
MSQSTVFYRCRSSQNGFALLETEFESWKNQHIAAMAAWDADDWMDECIARKDEPLRMQKVVFGCLFEKRLYDTEAAGNAVLDLFDGALGAFHKIRPAIDKAQSLGYELNNLRKFEDAQRELESAKKQFVDRWPWRNPILQVRALADYENGDCIDLGDFINAVQNSSAWSD